MKQLSIACAILVLVVGHTSPAAAVPPFKAMLERVLPGMGAADIAARQTPQQEFQTACRALAAPGREAERAEASRLIAARLGPETSNPARVFMLRQLRVIGQAECVPAVARLLGDKDVEVKTWACWALEGNPAPQANAAIATALRSAEGTDWRVTLINALGSRAASESVDLLIGCLADQDNGVGAAAAVALGKIGTPKATEALVAAIPLAPPPRRRSIGDACLRAAERLVGQGRREQAQAVYRKLNSSEQSRAVRLAAQQGLLSVAGDALAALIVEMLSESDPDARALAAGHLASVRDEGVWKRLVTDFPRLPPEGQVLLLGALAARGDKSVVAMIHAAVDRDNQDIRVAAIRALARVGDASSVPVLIRALAAGGRAGAAARESLHQVFGQGVEESLVAAMKGAGDDRVRERLIDVLDGRNAVAAVPAILEECRHPSPAVRDRAVRALGRLAEVGDLGPLIRCLLAATSDDDREAIEKAIQSICAQIENEAERADPVMQWFDTASLGDKSRLLPVIGRIGAAKTLPMLRQTAESGPPELREAAVRALANWPRAEVADDLVRIARNSGQQPLRIQALRGYTRVIAVPGSRPPREMLAAFQGAMALAERDQERGLILTRATTARDVETLRWVAAHLSHPTLGQAACRAVVELAHHRELVKGHRAEFMAALEKVIRTANDATLVDRARLYMQQ